MAYVWPRAVGLASAASTHPTIAPKRRSLHSVSQKWRCATEAGISGLGMSSAKLHTPNSAAMMLAVSILPVFNILTAGDAKSAHKSAPPHWKGSIHGGPSTAERTPRYK